MCPASANPNRNVTQVIRLPVNKADKRQNWLDTGKKRGRKISPLGKKTEQKSEIFQANKSLAKANRFSTETKLEGPKSKERHGTKR